jgi:hypothetical protein
MFFFFYFIIFNDEKKECTSVMELKTLAILLLVVCVCVREANQLAIPKLEWQTQLLSDVCIYGNFHEYCTNREREIPFFVTPSFAWHSRRDQLI